ncbi:MAG: tetratricopeptide repeat protein [Methylococcales bacterium]|nr:tetratricopeptide repeat protein [Methylococcales bacterium]MCK5479319.1 tetratricopeptide repeat protein [Methylococcales bacterium]
MEIYDTEEEQVAAIKRWWKENGTSTITGIVVGVVLIAGWNFWQSYTKDKAKNASALYEQLLDSISTEKNESAEKIAERITEQYGSTAYATYAALLLAKTKVQQGDLDAAKNILEKQMRDADSAELKNVARIRLIKLMLATDENEKGLQLIAEVDQSSAQGFSASYDELKGDLYVALDRLGEARTAYQSALRAGVKSPLLQFKLDDITAAEIVESNIE